MKNKKKETDAVRSVYKTKKYSHDRFFMSPSTRNRYNDYPNLQVLCDELSACNVDDYDDVQDIVKGYKE